MFQFMRVHVRTIELWINAYLMSALHVVYEHVSAIEVQATAVALELLVVDVAVHVIASVAS